MLVQVKAGQNNQQGHASSRADHMSDEELATLVIVKHSRRHDRPPSQQHAESQQQQQPEATASHSSSKAFHDELDAAEVSQVRQSRPMLFWATCRTAVVFGSLHGASCQSHGLR